MPEWLSKLLSNPLTWTAILGVLAGLIYWKGKVDAKLGSLDDRMTEIRGDIKRILERLPPRTVTANSPLRVTDFGEKIATAFGAQQWARDVARPVATRLVDKEPFEIDDFCQNYVDNMLDQHDDTRVESLAYNYGIESKDVLQVLRVVLRDEILKLLDNQFRCVEDDDEKMWHSTKACPHWPTENFEVSLTEPTVGTYCTACIILKEAEGDVPF